MHPGNHDRWGERHAWPDRAIADLADRQRTMVTTAQLRELGVAPRTIGKAVARGRLHRVHRGVHSLVLPASRPRFAGEQAALLACGPTAVLSHFSAATLHGLRLPARVADIHVTTSASSDRRHPELRIHRTTARHPQERVRVDRLPVTSLARTLIDLAPMLTDAMLEPLLDQALRRTSATKLTEALARHPRRPGTPRLRRLLDPDRPSADTWSKAEARLLAAIRRAGLPAPEANVALEDYVPDLLWRAQRVAVEYDSEDVHDKPGAFHSDRTRHNDLTTRSGLQVLHVTGRQLAERPEQVIVWIALALARGGYGD